MAVLSPCLLQPSASVKDVDRMTATAVVIKYFIRPNPIDIGRDSRAFGREFAGDGVLLV